VKHVLLRSRSVIPRIRREPLLWCESAGIRYTAERLQLPRRFRTRVRNYWTLLGISETEGKRRQAKCKKELGAWLLVGGIKACELPGGEGVRMIGADGRWQMFRGRLSGCSSLIVLALGCESAGQNQVGSTHNSGRLVRLRDFLRPCARRALRPPPPRFAVRLQVQ
jgi:hypothetical protein